MPLCVGMERPVPTYVYRNPEGALQDFVFRVGNRPDSFTDESGVRWRFDANETYRGVKTQHCSGWPMEFTPLSVMPWQAAEAARKFPEREYASDGRCIARSKSHLEKMAKKADLVDRSRQRVRPSSAKKLKVSA